MVYRKNPPDHKVLRQLAMDRLSGRGVVPTAALDSDQTQRLLEELEIHQIELELQNEHLNTARAQLERALNQSSELYDFSPVGSVLIDTDGAITKMNLAAAQLLASERATLMGSRFGLYVAEVQRPQLNAMLERARVEREAQTGELTLLVSGQDPAHVQARVVWLDAVSGWQIGLIDVSERQRMEAQLRASEERLTMALSAVGDGVWDWNIRTGEVQVSEGFAELMGFASGELERQASKLMWRVHPDDKPQLVQKLQDCLSGQLDRYYSEHRMQCKDGGWKWILGRGAVVLRAADGQALRVIGTLVDISQKKQAEAALAASAQFQQAVFDSVSAQIAVLDQSGCIMQTNEAWRSYVSGLNGQESVGKSYQEVLPNLVAQDLPTIQAVAAGMAAVATGEVPYFHAPEPVHCPCGDRWFTIKITPVHDVAHRMVVTHEDVSVLKRAELASAALANVDSLTGALSRQHFLSLAEQEMARSRRYDVPLVVLMLDLDHFKHVNDTYGHQAGDAVLQGFVQTVKSVLRESDSIGRIGGEEFGVLMPSTTHEGGYALANRILEEVRSSPVEVDGHRIDCTVSIGAAALSEHASFADLLAQCDKALYRAKNTGRDRLEVSWESLVDVNH